MLVLDLLAQHKFVLAGCHATLTPTNDHTKILIPPKFFNIF